MRRIDEIEASLKELYVDPRIDDRLGGLDRQVATEYAERPVHTMPPGKAAWLDGRLVLVGGKHRAEALRMLGLRTFRVELYEGTVDELYELALRDNADAKLRYTADQRDANIRRLLSMGWQPTDISLELGFGKNTVDKIKRADRMRKQLGERWLEDDAGRPERPFSAGHYIELATAPPEHLEELADAVSRRGWTTAETRAAVQGLKRGTFPEQFRQRLLQGGADPYQIDQASGEPAVLKETLARRLERHQRSDALLGLLELAHRFEIWQDTYATQGLQLDLSRERAARVDGQLGRMAEIIGGVRMELHRLLHPETKEVL